MRTETRKQWVLVHDANGRIAGGYVQTVEVEVYEEPAKASDEYLERLESLKAQAAVSLQREFSDTRSIKRPVIVKAS